MASTTRSPNYPALNLSDALAGVRKVYEAEGTRRTSGEEVAKALGHKSLSGSSRVKVSALRKYGLLKADDDGIKVSDDAISLLELPSDHHDYIAALRSAATRPALFGELVETYGETVPSNSILRHFLIKKQFNPKVADEVVQIYRETMELVSGSPTTYTPTDNDEQDEQQEIEEMETHHSAEVPPASRNFGVGSATSLPHSPVSAEHAPYTESLEIRVSGDSKVRLLFEGVVTKESIGKLIKYLELAEDDYPSKEEVKQATKQLPESPSGEQSIEPPAFEMPAASEQ